MSIIRISDEEFTKHKDSIIQRYQQLGITQVEAREEKRENLTYYNLIGYKMSFDGTTETKSTLFPLEKEIDVLENKTNSN